MSATHDTLVFPSDDPYGLWKAGDTCLDLGWESDDLPIRMLELQSGEIICLSDVKVLEDLGILDA